MTPRPPSPSTLPQGTRAPRIGLGCASLGQPSVDDRSAQEVIAAAIAHGIRFFDVAPLYGGGLAEERLGRALRELPRDEYLLCTKTGVTRPYGQPPKPPGATRAREFDRWDYSAQATRASIEHSLARLGTDRLDLVHLHDAEDHLDDCLTARDELERMRERGVVGGIGIGSNLVAPVESLLSRARFDAFLLAGCYTLLDRSGADLIASAHARGIRVIVGGIYNSGVLATWPQPAPTFGYRPAPADVLARTAEIAAICRDHGVALGTAALQFVLANPAIDTVLLGPRTVAELDANLEAAQAAIPAALWRDLGADVIAAGDPAPAEGARAASPCATAANGDASHVLPACSDSSVR